MSGGDTGTPREAGLTVVDAGASALGFESATRRQAGPAVSADRVLLPPAALFSGTATQARAWLDRGRLADTAPQRASDRGIDFVVETGNAAAVGTGNAAFDQHASTTTRTDTAPVLARRLRAAGAAAVCLVDDVDSPEARGRAVASLRVWVDSDHACGWVGARLAAPGADGPALSRRYTEHLTAACARGFVAADAAVLAAMACSAGSAAQAGGAACLLDPLLLPTFSWGDAPCPEPLASAAAPVEGDTARPAPSGVPPPPHRRLDLYAIVDSADRVLQVLAADVRTVQLRIKTPASHEPGGDARLRDAIRRSIAACRAVGAELYVNDHWQLAAELGAGGVHLGQEDLLALGESGRAALQASGLALGISSHSLWELCRARALAPRYIACGPVWPTLTKAMPWQAQGLDNLAWWCRLAGTPVVAIGGVLEAWQVQAAARCGADGVCIVRGLGDDPRSAVPALQAALDAGRAEAPVLPPAVGPHPSLTGDAAAMG